MEDRTEQRVVLLRTLASRDGCLDVRDGEAGIRLNEVGAVCKTGADSARATPDLQGTVSAAHQS